MALQIDARFSELDPFTFKKFSLQRGVRFANQNFAAFAENAMPGNASSGRGGGHRASSGARAAGQAQESSEGSISKNTAAGDLFYQAIDGIPRHS